MSQVEITARFDGDTKRTHRYIIESKDGVAGSIYVSKETSPLPKTLVVTMKTKTDE